MAPTQCRECNRDVTPTQCRGCNRDVTPTQCRERNRDVTPTQCRECNRGVMHVYALATSKLDAVLLPMQTLSPDFRL
eukprot:152070-Chlamydomonas_euryale.AAC.2